MNDGRVMVLVLVPWAGFCFSVDSVGLLLAPIFSQFLLVQKVGGG